MTNTLPDFVTETWHINDVKSLDDTLTDDQCREVLQAVQNNHDANIGINWGVIEYYIDRVMEQYE